MSTVAMERARASAMGSERSSVLAWAPSLTALVFAVPTVLLYWQLGGPSALLNDPNTGFHVRVGEWILSHRAIPREDLFSFTLAGHEWVDWEWLADAIFALLHRAGGLAGVATLSMVLLGGIAVAVYRTTRLHAGRIVASSVTCLVMSASMIHWLARPHLFSWFLLAWLVWVVEKVRVSGRVQWLFAVPIFMLLWVNLHPGFVAGLLVLFVWCCAEGADAALANHPAERRERRMRDRWLAGFVVVCAAITLANPHGFRLHEHVVAYLFSAPSVTGQVAEWFPPDFHNPRVHWFELMLALGCAAGVWHGVRRRWAWCVLTLGSLHAALLSVRNVPLCAILSAAPVAGMIEEFLATRDWSRALLEAEHELLRIEPRGRSLVFGILAALVLGLVWTQPIGFGPRSLLPVEAVAHVPEGLLFTTDRWADYLIYMKPKQRVFFDCRSDFYGEQFVHDYVTVMEARTGWEEILEHHGVGVVLAPQASTLRAVLARSARWTLGYHDRTAALFIRTSL